MMKNPPHILSNDLNFLIKIKARSVFFLGIYDTEKLDFETGGFTFKDTQYLTILCHQSYRRVWPGLILVIY